MDKNICPENKLGNVPHHSEPFKNEIENINETKIFFPQQDETRDQNFGVISSGNKNSVLRADDNKNLQCYQGTSIRLAETICTGNKVQTRDSIFENSLQDNYTLNSHLTSATHVTPSLMALTNEATSSLLIGTENYEEAQSIMGYVEQSTENTCTGEVSMETEKNATKNADFADKENMEKINSLENVSPGNEASTESCHNRGKSTSESGTLKNSEIETFHRLIKNKTTSTEAKSNVYETDAKIPHVSTMIC